MKLNATRMALRDQKQRLAIAIRGHRLLKDKQDALIQQFVVQSEAARILRLQVEAQFKRIDEAYKIAAIESYPHVLNSNTKQSTMSGSLKLSYEPILSLSVPKFTHYFEFNTEPQKGLFQTHSRIVAVQSEYHQLMGRLIDLAEKEAACILLGDDIKKTRRRVNALEFKTIPDMRALIRRIEIQIEDQDRAQLSRIMKVK